MFELARVVRITEEDVIPGRGDERAIEVDHESGRRLHQRNRREQQSLLEWLT
jgi:hypothetical protein